MAKDDEFWFLEEFDWGAVQACYNDRKAACRKLRALFRGDDVDAFARYALGMVDAAANFSADEHSLGPKIFEHNLRAAKRVRELSLSLVEARDPRRVTALIRRADIAYCRVRVGSELSCMLVPEVYWVCNSRSLLVVFGVVA
jgi:hypothetical protein